jgi:hypothetical protein
LESELQHFLSVAMFGVHMGGEQPSQVVGGHPMSRMSANEFPKYVRPVAGTPMSWSADESKYASVT